MGWKYGVVASLNIFGKCLKMSKNIFLQSFYKLRNKRYISSSSLRRDHFPLRSWPWKGRVLMCSVVWWVACSCASPFVARGVRVRRWCVRVLKFILVVPNICVRVVVGLCVCSTVVCVLVCSCSLSSWYSVFAIRVVVLTNFFLSACRLGVCELAPSSLPSTNLRVCVRSEII